MISATRMLCQKYTDLTDGEIAHIESYNAILPALANAGEADVFIDCRTSTGRSAIVVCEAKPQTVPSNYERTILGMLIQWRDEPAVDRSFRLQVPTVGMRAVSMPEDRRIILRKGEGIWINANKMHMVRRVEGMSSAALFTILFLPEFIAPRTDVIYQKYVQPWLTDPEMCYILLLDSVPWHRETAETLTRAFLTHSERGFGYEMSVHNDICAAWLMMLQHQKEVPRQASSGAELTSQERIRTMAAFIQRNFAEHITLTQIADSAHVSRSEAIRCFKKNLNVTPIQFLTEYRIEQAAQMLISSSEPISSIASRCGFDDVSYFTKQFRQIQNVTPSKYRKNNQKR